MRKTKIKQISWATLALGICFIIFGAWRGEAGTVLNKAIHICLECIGIG